MDILKQLLNNPGLHNVAETIIGYMDRKIARELAETSTNGELLSEDEQKFVMKTMRRFMFNDAKAICDKPYYYHEQVPYMNGERYQKSIFQMFPFFKEALHLLKSSECLESFKQLGKILSLLEDVIEDEGIIDADGIKLGCLPGYTNVRGAKGPQDMIRFLESGRNYYRQHFDHLIEIYGVYDKERDTLIALFSL